MVLGLVPDSSTTIGLIVLNIIPTIQTFYLVSLKVVISGRAIYL